MFFAHNLNRKIAIKEREQQFFLLDKNTFLITSFIVVDEWVGQWITFSFLPVNYTIAILGFLLFRFFDISKVGPVKYFEKLPGAWGVMADDVIAGILSMVSLLLIQYYIL